MRTDNIEYISNSLIQHGPLNDRIYLMRLDEGDVFTITDLLDDFAMNERYSKVFAKVLKPDSHHFLYSGYSVDAEIPCFFEDEENELLFLSKFISQERSKTDDIKAINDVIKKAREEKAVSSSDSRAEDFLSSLTFRKAGEKDTEEMSELYESIYKTYPFPIFSSDYLKMIMSENVTFYAALKNGEIVGLSSAEYDEYTSTVEMSDFACRKDCRGRGVSRHLLKHMESDAAEAGFKVAFTIARALSYPMNITFARQGYTYAGTSINNTNISGRIESMNIWYMKL